MKPPMWITLRSLCRAIVPAVLEPTAATIYVVLPWWASRYLITALLTFAPPALAVPPAPVRPPLPGVPPAPVRPPLPGVPAAREPRVALLAVPPAAGGRPPAPVPAGKAPPRPPPGGPGTPRGPPGGALG